MKKTKVLLIEDDDGILDAVTLILEEEGYTVFPLADATIAVETVKSFQPDIILLDVLISGVDGRDVCRELKSSDEFKDIPIIMVSAHPAIKETISACGANDFLAKPFEFDDLINCLESYVSPKE